VFGRINVFAPDHEEVTRGCTIRFTREADQGSETLAVGALDETGWVFTTMEHGRAYLIVVVCAFQGGLISNQFIYWRDDLTLEVPGPGRAAYFGHLHLAIRPVPQPNSNFFKEGWLLIESSFEEAKREFIKRYGRPANITLVTSLINDGTTRIVEPPPNVVHRDTSIEVSSKLNGVGLTWFATPSAGNGKVGVRVVRVSARAELKDCKQAVFVSDGRAVEVPITYSSGGISTLTQEVLQGELDLDAVKGIANAERVELQVCGLTRELSTLGRTALTNFVGAFETEQGASRAGGLPAASPPSAATAE